jgi:uncharacterized protein YaaN involved in tellurite resistance
MSEMNNVPEIKLTLDPFGEKAEQEIQTALEEKTDVREQAGNLTEFAKANLTPEEQKTVEEFAKQIDITDTNMTLQYGAGTQQKLADFSDTALASVRTQDLGETGDMLVKLTGELKSFNDDIDGKGGFSLFRSAKKKIETLKVKYDKVEKGIDNIVTVLDNHQVALLKDIAVLDKLYEADLMYFKELSMYILAGKARLEEERATTLPALLQKAQESGLPEDSQRANDFAAKCDHFERKLYDLELSRTVAMQMGPQIRLVQNNDALMSEKIRSTIVNTIPLWKSQMIIALGLAHSEEALRAEHAVNDMTNELLKKNAALLHQSTVKTAQESERGIIDIETLTQTNKELIDTLDDVQRIHVEGKQKRLAAEGELARIEEELKNKLLELR